MIVIMFGVKRERSGVKVSREQMAENRRRILEAAARLFREHGFEGVKVADVMGAAGLTHGGFYGHFGSKEDLFAQACALAAAPADRVGERPFGECVAAYLSPRHRDARAGGCAFAALGAEAARGAPEARHALREALRDRIDRMARVAPGEDAGARRAAAIAGFAGMLGGLVLSRIAGDDPDLSEEILRATREALMARPEGGRGERD